MSHNNSSWQEKIKTLGSEEERKLLQRLCQDDPDLADAVTASAIQHHLDEIGLQEVSRDLQQKLYAITDKQSANKKPILRSWQFWAAWAGLAAVLLITITLKPWQSTQQPSSLEIAEARRQLTVAFQYLNHSADLTRYYTESSLVEGMAIAMNSASFSPEVKQRIDL